MSGEFIESIVSGDGNNAFRQLQDDNDNDNDLNSSEDYSPSAPSMLFLSFYAFGSLALLLVWMSARSYRLRMVRAATMAEERRREEMEEEMKIKEAPMKRKVFIQSFHDCKICKELSEEDFVPPSSDVNKQSYIQQDPENGHMIISTIDIGTDTTETNGFDNGQDNEADKPRREKQKRRRRLPLETDDDCEKDEIASQTGNQNDAAKKATNDKQQQQQEDSDQIVDEGNDIEMQANNTGDDSTSKTSDSTEIQEQTSLDASDAFLNEVGTIRIPCAAAAGGGGVVRAEVANLCAICLEPYNSGETIVWSNNTRCSHAFHQECLLGYLLHLKNSSADEPPCPCCRQIFWIKPKNSQGPTSNEPTKPEE